MSGHEKFYTPHEDLVALETALGDLELAIDELGTVSMASLETAIDLTTTAINTLETTTRTLTAVMPVPRSELFKDNAGAPYESAAVD